MSKKKEQEVKAYRPCSKCGRYVEVIQGKLKRHVYIISGKWCKGE